MPRTRLTPILVILTWAALALGPGRAAAFEPPLGGGRFAAPSLPAALLPAAALLAREIPAQMLARVPRGEDGLGFDGLGDRLRQLPLYPILIGVSPRTPSDPDLGVGVVWRIPLTL